MSPFKKDPIEIHLSEIPKDGQDFDYTDQHPAMRNALKDVINKNSFKIQVLIKPWGNLFEVTGLVETSLDLQCYRCAVDFIYPIKEKIHEFLMIEDKRPRSSQSARVSHSLEFNLDTPFVTSLTSDVFHLGDFFHGIIALSEPIQPKAKEDCGENCENLEEAYCKGWLHRPGQENISPENDSNRPFNVLKNFKLNS